MHQNHMELVPAVTVCQNTGRDALYITVMICAPYIDYPVKAAEKLCLYDMRYRKQNKLSVHFHE